MKNFSVFVRTLVFICVLGFVPMQRTHAIASGVALGAGASIAGKLALNAIAIPTVTYVTGYAMAVYGDRRLGYLGLILHAAGVITGVILLNNDSNIIEFNQLKEGFVKNLSLTDEQIRTYNSEIEEVNFVMQEVQAQLDEGSSLMDAKELWSIYKVYLSKDTIKVMEELVRVSPL